MRVYSEEDRFPALAQRFYEMCSIGTIRSYF